MSPEKKVVKGGFRATLALIVSIIALVFAVLAFNRTGGDESYLNSKARQETAKSIENLGKSLQGDKGKP